MLVLKQKIKVYSYYITVAILYSNLNNTFANANANNGWNTLAI